MGWKAILAWAGAIGSAAVAPHGVWAQEASAGNNAAAQALGECMVLKSTGADRLVVARWFVSSIASAPQTAGVATVAPGQKAELDKGMAALFTRLMAVDCADQSRPVFAAKDTGEGFRVAGEALGRVAIMELLGNPQANAALGAYTQYLKKEDFKDVLPK